MAVRVSRLAVAAALLAVLGCSAAPEPATNDDGAPSKDEEFLADIAGIGAGVPDQDLLTAAQDACFEMELHVKTRRDFRLFYKVFAAREVVPPDEVPLLLAAAMKTYCPSMEKFRPANDAPA